MKENKMAVMPIQKLFFNMSLPLMISMLVQSMYNIVDGMFVAKISQEALTATSIAYSAQMLQIAVAVGTGVGVNVVVSRSLGAKQYDKVNLAAMTGLVLTLLSSCIFILWGIFGTQAFVSLFTTNNEIIHLSTSYLRICQIFSTGIFLGTYYQRILQATGRTFSSMLAQILGAVMNIVLDPLLIFYFHMGIQGAAIATVIGQWSAAILGYILNKVQNKEVHFTWSSFHMDRNMIIRIYKIGFPTILVQAIGSVMMASMNMVLGMYSTMYVALFGVYYKLQSFLFMPMNGLGQAIMPIISFNKGANNKKRIRDTTRVALVSGMCIGLAGTCIFMIFPQALLSMYSASYDMLKLGVSVLRIISVTFIFTSCTMIIGYIISGLGNAKINMISTFLRQLIVLIPCVYILGKDHLWYAFWISEGIAFIYASIQYRKNMKSMVEF